MFNGTIPSYSFTFPLLEILYLGGNNLSDVLETSKFGKLGNLIELDLSNNMLSLTISNNSNSIKFCKNIGKHRYIGRFNISILRIINMNFGNV